MNIYSPIQITEEIRNKFKPTQLYIKELAGIKYFGKTTLDPYSYSGSGKIWKDRIKKYGKDKIKTLWISDVYHNPDELQTVALHFSEENRIVESNEWANLQPENGLNGAMHTEHTLQKMKDTKIKNGTTNPFTAENRKMGVETKNKNGTNSGSPNTIRKQLETRKNNGTLNTALKALETKKKNGTLNPNTTESRKKAMDKMRQDNTHHFVTNHPGKIEYLCPQCGKIVHGKNNYNRYHGDKCKKINPN